MLHVPVFFENVVFAIVSDISFVQNTMQHLYNNTHTTCFISCALFHNKLETNCT